MATIDVNDTTIYFERSGQGPAVLFVHGTCGSADVWADQAARLHDRYTCVRYDRRGHSRSARGSAPISPAVHADDAASLIETLGLDPCLLVGSSAGAAIGVDVAMRHARMLRGAVLSEPALFSLDPAARQLIGRELGPIVARAETDPRGAVDAFFEHICPGLWGQLDEQGKDHYRANADIAFTDMRSPALEVTPDDLAATTLPVLVIAGTTSHPALRSVARRLAAALPVARLVELAGSGHVTYAERPDAFAHAVSTFACELDRRAPVTSSTNHPGGAR